MEKKEMKTHTSEGKLFFDVGELCRKTLAKRPKTMANKSLAKRLVGETTAIPFIYLVTGLSV